MKKAATAVPIRAAEMVDSAADAEGYYQIVLGEVVDNGKYQVFSNLGKGMFSGVVRARVLTGDEVGKEVAIKIIRSQAPMYVFPPRLATSSSSFYPSQVQGWS